jgi:hypothetical protein
MSVSLIQAVVSLPQSPFPPLAVGFMGLGFFHLGTGFWLMYLVFAVVLNFVLDYALPL